MKPNATSNAQKQNCFIFQVESTKYRFFYLSISTKVSVWSTSISTGKYHEYLYFYFLLEKVQKVQVQMLSSKLCKQAYRGFCWTQCKKLRLPRSHQYYENIMWYQTELMKYIKYTVIHFNLTEYSDAYSLTEILLDITKRYLIRKRSLLWSI
jgi:hypothetical protein